MELKLIRHLWGVYDPWEKVFPQFKELGYSGVEIALFEPERGPALRKQLSEVGLDLVIMAFTGGSNADEHLRSLEEQVEQHLRLAPLFINAHSGSDGWNQDQAKRFYEGALKIESRAGVPIAHETHRGRVFFNPWVTRDIIQEFPELKLTCDYSHWVCVAERLLDDEKEILELCARHAMHIHGRVGYEEGPQVPDPRAPEYRGYLEAHERWWDMIWNSQQARGVAVSTLTPEFGPPSYMHTLPYTNVPVADLWDICNWMAKREAERFRARPGPKE